MKNIITLEKINFAYEKHIILEEASIDITMGEYVGIFGPNGGGKTTLLRLIMGFLKPISGKIEIFGKNPKDARNKIAYVPQSYPFDKKFPISVFEIVLGGLLSDLPWWGVYRLRDKEKALYWIDKMGLNDHIHASFGTLSGGLAKRTLIARALVSNPELLLLDEPTSGIDSKTESEIYDILDGLKGKITILMVTHDLRFAINKVQKVILVQKNVVSLKPEDVCEHFAVGLYHPPLVKEGGS